MRVLSLCDFTGNMVRPWAEAGYGCVCVDLQHSDRVEGRTEFFCEDVRALSRGRMWIGGVPDFVIAQPPCTELAGSGARWWAEKGIGPLIDALTLIKACVDIAEAAGCPWMLENPVGRLSTCWRRPDWYFHPWHYSALEPDDNYTKKTCLWTGGGFIMPERAVDESLGDPCKKRIHYASPSPDRANQRSAAPLGFARAVFESNQIKRRHLSP